MLGNKSSPKIMNSSDDFYQFFVVFREIKTHEEGLLKRNRILKCYTRRKSKCMRLT